MGLRYICAIKYQFLEHFGENEGDGEGQSNEWVVYHSQSLLSTVSKDHDTLQVDIQNKKTDLPGESHS